jgi:hypothetical protein
MQLWIKESNLPITELQFPNVDPQWWMFLCVEKQKDSHSQIM